jgi:hypothetical protein
MPSGARLMAAILLALAMMGGVYLAAYHDPELAESRNSLFGLAAGLGAFCGWTMLGSRLGNGFLKTAGWSMAVMTLTGFWFLFILAARQAMLPMLNMVRLYPDPLDAFEALISRFMGYVGYIADVQVLLAAFLGALIAGAISEYCRMIWN